MEYYQNCQNLQLQINVYYSEFLYVYCLKMFYGERQSPKKEVRFNSSSRLPNDELALDAKKEGPFGTAAFFLPLSSIREVLDA